MKGTTEFSKQDKKHFTAAATSERELEHLPITQTLLPKCYLLLPPMSYDSAPRLFDSRQGQSKN